MKSLTRCFQNNRARHKRVAPRTHCLFVLSFACLVVFSSVTGCGTFKKNSSTEDYKLTKIFNTGQPAPPTDPGELQQSLLQFAESYCLKMIESVDEITGVEGSPFNLEKALHFKISNVGSVITLATGDNPNINLLNLLALSSLSHMAMENYWVKTPHGALYESWLTRSQTLENKIWSIGEKVLTEEQQKELRDTIEQYYASRKDFDSLIITHPQDLMIPKNLMNTGNARSVFSLASINPFSGLDPTVREIAQTRLFAERALFSIQWMPWLLRWQSELLVLEATNQPEIAQTLKDVTNLSDSIQRASLAAESLSKTAATLPDQLSTEREAIVKAMDEQEGQITTLLEAGSEMSVSVNEAVESIDALMKRFGVGEPKPPRDPNRKRFDILDYAKTADSFTATAEQLNTTLAELNATLDSPALDNLSRQAKADARSILNHFFLLAGGLVLLILGSALIYRKGTRSGSDINP